MIRRKERKDGLVPRDYWGTTWVNPMSLIADMDKVFDDFKSDWENTFMVPRALSTDLVRQPLIDLADNGNEYVVKAEVPGIKKEDLNIEITENAIEISGETKSEEKQEEDKGYLRRERRYSSFFRTLPLPDAILTDKSEAELKDGVLTVKLPKRTPPPEKKGKKIQVK